jgi:predicted Zn finger-like uncharacterized protein
MSLATRCTACGTVFRVVQDQLKVSEGWVRCGRCDEVFSALEGLFDLERDSPPQGVSSMASRPPALFEPMHTVDAPAGGSDDATDAHEASLIDKIDAQLLGSRRSEHGLTPAARISERDRLEFPDAQFDPDLVIEDSMPADHLSAPETPRPAEDAVASVPAESTEFMRRAQREARWHSPRVRAALACAAGALLVSGALQIGNHFRDLMAARWPGTQPLLGAWCSAFACKIDVPRRIDDVFVESSSLTRAAAADAFRLSLTLRNRGNVTVALPSVDLALTDPSGQLIARRVLHPSDFRVAGTSMASGAESILQLVLASSGARITGYTVEIFYP